MPRHQLHNWLMHWCLLLCLITCPRRADSESEGRAPPPPGKGREFHLSWPHRSDKASFCPIQVNFKMIHHHPTYCTPAEADISNSWCRRKQWLIREALMQVLKQQQPAINHDERRPVVLPQSIIFCGRLDAEYFDTCSGWS